MEETWTGPNRWRDGRESGVLKGCRREPPGQDKAMWARQALPTQPVRKHSLYFRTEWYARINITPTVAKASALDCTKAWLFFASSLLRFLLHPLCLASPFLPYLLASFIPVSPAIQPFPIDPPPSILPPRATASRPLNRVYFHSKKLILTIIWFELGIIYLYRNSWDS